VEKEYAEVEVGNGKHQRNFIGRRIAYLRSERNLSQEVLVARLQCEGLDISRDVLANIETGRTEVKDALLPYFQRALRVQIVRLFPTCVQVLDEKLAVRAGVRSLKTRSCNGKS
jgi:transcriptional regulator with XRE-family HTH domain